MIQTCSLRLIAVARLPAAVTRPVSAANDAAAEGVLHDDDVRWIPDAYRLTGRHQFAHPTTPEPLRVSSVVG